MDPRPTIKGWCAPNMTPSYTLYFHICPLINYLECISNDVPYDWNRCNKIKNRNYHSIGTFLKITKTYNQLNILDKCLYNLYWLWCLFSLFTIALSHLYPYWYCYLNAQRRNAHTPRHTESQTHAPSSPTGKYIIYL